LKKNLHFLIDFQRVFCRISYPNTFEKRGELLSEKQVKSTLNVSKNTCGYRLRFGFFSCYSVIRFDNLSRRNLLIVNGLMRYFKFNAPFSRACEKAVKNLSGIRFPRSAKHQTQSLAI